MESVTRQIYLPDDNVTDFGLVLEYLYTGDFPFEGSIDLKLEDQLAEVYILADKYQLPLLKELVIAKLRSSMSSNVTTAARSLTFLTIAHKIYHGTLGSESDEVFYQFFADTAISALEKVDTNKLHVVEEMIDDGGRFATDVFALQLCKMQRDKSVLAERYERLEEELRMARRDISATDRDHITTVEELQSLQASFNNLQIKSDKAAIHHTAAHPHCMLENSSARSVYS